MGSIPTRSRQPRSPLSALLLVCVLAAALPHALRAQQRDSARAGIGATPPARPDSVLGPPLSPRSAFLHSLAVPGWAQIRLGHRKTALLFGLIEAGAIFMNIKTRHNLGLAKRAARDSTFVGIDSTVTPPVRLFAPGDTALVTSRKQQVEDWTAILIFNHLFAGAEAYVSAHLWDLPAHVSVEPAPGRLRLVGRFTW